MFDNFSDIEVPDQNNFTEYTECVNKYYAQAGQPANQSEAQMKIF